MDSFDDTTQGGYTGSGTEQPLNTILRGEDVLDEARRVSQRISERVGRAVAPAGPDFDADLSTALATARTLPASR